MSKVKHYIWTLAALPILAACSQNDFPGGENGMTVNEGDGVYMTVNFAPNTQKGTRSFTDGDNSSNTGVEVGSDDENKINRVLLVLARSSDDTDIDNTLITFATINKNAIASSNNNTIYQANAKFQKTDLAQYYANLPTTSVTENPEIKVFLYCNYSDATLAYFNGIKNAENPGNTWVNEVYKLNTATDNNLWSTAPEAGFVMTNVSMSRRRFPANLTEWNYYTTESNPFDLSGMNNEGTDAEVDNLGSEGREGGAIEVHRMAARFDFADGSQWDKDDAPNGNGIKGEPFTYAIMTNGTDDAGNDVVLVKGSIVNLSLVNLFNKEYYLERVSNNGFNTNSILLGAEKPWFTSQPSDSPRGGNYVVSPEVSFKNDFSSDKIGQIGDYFNYPFFDPATGRVAEGGKGWYTTYVNDIMNGANDATSFYKVWRYVTENTLPGEDAQVNGLSTGVVFKVKLKGGDALNAEDADVWDKALYAALNNDATAGRGPEKDPILYAFSGKLYCGWEHVQVAALAAAGYNDQLPAGKEHDEQVLDYAASLYKAVFGNGCPGTLTINGKEITLSDPTFNDGKIDESSANVAWQKWVDAGRPGTGTPTNEAFKEAVVGATFTIYQTSQDQKEGWGYYCYYYYWNRHNDNGIDGVMAPMEFATVRNNVYKLAVTRLKTLGHPRIPENDPNEPTPDTPDENGDIYLTVSVTVKPWVVRINNIEF